MLIKRSLQGLFVMAVFCAGSTAQSFSWKLMHPLHTKPHQPRAAPPTTASNLIHTQARFVYDGKVLAPVVNAQALLFDSTDPATHDVVEAINHGGDGVQQATKVCSAYVSGKGRTVAPGGDIYFDYVAKGNYWILVCTQVMFAGVAKPVWVAGAVSITSSEFNASNAEQYELPRPVQIVLDPYATELRTKPVEISSVASAP
jgi:hypothetical protein